MMEILFGVILVCIAAFGLYMYNNPGPAVNKKIDVIEFVVSDENYTVFLNGNVDERAPTWKGPAEAVNCIEKYLNRSYWIFLSDFSNNPRPAIKKKLDCSRKFILSKTKEVHINVRFISGIDYYHPLG